MMRTPPVGCGLDTLPRRVAVLRALKLGDLLCAVPALRALRAAWPEATIDLIGLPWAAAFADRFRHLLHGFREFPGFPGLPEQAPRIERLPAFLTATQAEHYDLAIQLHGSGSFVNPLVELFGARACAGFYRPGDYRPDPARFIPWPEEGTEVRRLLVLAEFLGAPPRGEHLEFPVWDEDRRRMRAVATDLSPGRYVCVHAGASVPERRWPPERFAAVSRWLIDRGLTIALTGTAGEVELAEAVANVAGGPRDSIRRLAGRTDLGSLAALLEGSRMLVCNDTGVSHLAAALRVPSVVLSTGDNPARWAPADQKRHRVLCRDGGVGVEAVIGETASLLARS